LRRCALLQRVGASYVVLLDGYYTDRDTGELVARRALETSEWPALIDACDQLMGWWDNTDCAQSSTRTDTRGVRASGRRFLGDSTMGLCFDVGHHAYRGHDPIAFLRRHYDRVEYLHLQTVDVAIQRAVEHDDLSLPCSRRGVFVEPWRGAVDFAALASVLDEVGYDGYAIVEQGMYPASGQAVPDRPTDLQLPHRLGYR
jgi:inosose dehydratase